MIFNIRSGAKDWCSSLYGIAQFRFKSLGLILIVLGGLPGLIARAADFREPRWGMSRRLVEQVKRIEEIEVKDAEVDHADQPVPEFESK